jgi:flavin reductase (DIM6/NTAB) family NADH-FMN oxidoreductase RutF
MKRSLGARTLLYPHPVLLVGTYDARGRPNLMTASWAGICCSQPPCVAVSLRKATYSHGSIVESRAFTLSIATVSWAKEADFAGIYSGRDEDKFQALGWTPVRSELVHAPYPAELPVILECQLVHTFELGLHTEFVGRILDVKADEEVLGRGGMPDLEKIQPLIFESGRQQYYGIGAYVGEAFEMGRVKQGL